MGKFNIGDEVRVEFIAKIVGKETILNETFYDLSWPPLRAWGITESNLCPLETTIRKRK